MQTFNKVIFLVLAIAGFSFWWSYQRKSAEYDRQVGALAATLDRRSLAADTPAAQAEALFRRAVVIYGDYRQLAERGRVSISEDQYLTDALNAAGHTSEPEINLISRNLRENLNLCQQLNLMDSDQGIQAMLTGAPLPIPKGSFKGDTLILARRIPSPLVPHLANHPANLAFIPSLPAALIWPTTLTGPTLRAIEEFRSQGILDSKTATDLRLRADSLRNSKP